MIPVVRDFMGRKRDFMGCKKVHIIGAGVAGLSCAVELAARGIQPIIHDMTRQAGGRCRSFYDSRVDAVIDNGNHLVLSGNHHLFAYLTRIGALSQWRIAPHARFPFFHIETGQHWAVELSDGLWPSWIFDRQRRPPGTDWHDFLPLLRLACSVGDKAVDRLLAPSSPAFETLWNPLILAVLNTPAQQASASLLRAMLWRSFLRGGRYSRPCTVRQSLSAALIDPALAWLNRHGASIIFSSRLRELVRKDDRVTGLRFSSGEEQIEPDTSVVLALPALTTAKLLPDLDVPVDHSPILNVHFRLPHSGSSDSGPSHSGSSDSQPSMPAFVGMVGGIGHWLFVRDHVASVTVSAADAWMAKDSPWLAQRIWSEVARTLYGREIKALPKYQIIREKRATFTQTPDSVKLRPAARTSLRNLLLAGDWVDTGLPATLESAVASGHTVARLIHS